MTGRILDVRATARMDSLTVSVADADLCSAVDRFGRFALYGVPAGTVRLEFAGGDVRQTVVIPDVEARDEIDIDLKTVPSP